MVRRRHTGELRADIDFALAQRLKKQRTAIHLIRRNDQHGKAVPAFEFAFGRENTSRTATGDPIGPSNPPHRLGQFQRTGGVLHRKKYQGRVRLGGAGLSQSRLDSGLGRLCG